MTPGRVFWVDQKRAFAARGGLIKTSTDGGQTWARVVRLPWSPWQRLVATHPLLRRFARAGVNHIVRCNGDDIVVFGAGRIYHVKFRTGRVSPNAAAIVGRRPLAVAVDGRRICYYGEYTNNPERRSISIMKSPDAGRSWETAHVMRGVRHVHGIYVDPFTDEKWVTTGDRDDESAIWRSADDFQSLERVLHGSQQTRAVQLLFTASYVYFGTDTELERNHIYRFDRARRSLERLCAVGSSVFWGSAVGRGLAFSTVVEPSRVNDTEFACVWGTLDGLKWHEVSSHRADLFSGKLFQYAQIMFPAGPGDGRNLWFTPVGTTSPELTRKIRLEQIGHA